MSQLAVLAAVKAPVIHWEAISPLLALTGGGVVVLLVGLLRARFARLTLTPVLTILTLAITAGLCVWQWDENELVISGALRIDNLTLFLTILFAAAGIGATLLALRAAAPEEAGHGEFYSLLLFSILGMVVLAGSENLVSVFIGYELLSIPLYILCATEMRRATSLESGLKYLIIGSVGSATLLYGLALIYGAAGSTDIGGIAEALDGEALGDPLLMTGIALTVAGIAFKASVAPFHQWTPDVYEGAPTAVTAFMAVATKVAAFGVMIRLFDVALISAAADWAPALAVLAVATIVIGNVGALTQTSLKRLLAYSSIAQAGYLLTGVVVSTRLGIEATAFYLAVYLLMNLAAFAVIVARERETGRGDDVSILYGLGADRPWLAWSMTIAMLSLAGFPATAGFFGKIELIRAAVDNEYTFLGVAIVLGSALSLAYYLRVVAAVWMRGAPETTDRPPAPLVGSRPAIAGGSQEADRERERRGNTDAGNEAEPAEASGTDFDPTLDRTAAGGADIASGTGRSAESEPEKRTTDAPLGETNPDVPPGPDDPRQPGAQEGVRGASPGYLHSDRDAAAGGGDAGHPSSGRTLQPPADAPDRRVAQPEVVFLAVLTAAATVFFGLYPEPLLDVAREAAESFTNLVA